MNVHLHAIKTDVRSNVFRRHTFVVVLLVAEDRLDMTAIEGIIGAMFYDAKHFNADFWETQGEHCYSINVWFHVPDKVIEP
jgi:hypothetical protein